MATTLPNNLPASSFRATPPEGRRWPCAAATVRALDQQVITSSDSARAQSPPWDGMKPPDCLGLQSVLEV